jgi:hypothetical protein
MTRKGERHAPQANRAVRGSYCLTRPRTGCDESEYVHIWQRLPEGWIVGIYRPHSTEPPA